MVASTIHNAIRAIFFVFFFSNFVKSLNIVSPTDGSTYVFGTLIPVNVVNSNIDTATAYTATFVCSAGTYQVTGLALGTTYTLIPAGLHGLTNLIVTAAGGTTAVTTIQITGPVPPTPCPSPTYAPTACLPSNVNPFSCNAESECPRPCYPTHNTPCDWQSYRRRSLSNRCSRRDKHTDVTFADYTPRIERRTNFNSNRCSRNEKRFEPCNATPNDPCERQTNRQNLNPNHCTRTEKRPNEPCDIQQNGRRSYTNRCLRNLNNQSDDSTNYRYTFHPRDRASFSQYSSFDQNTPIPPRFNTPFEYDPRDNDLF